jgi:ADP-ribose pyrophosphatase
MPVSSKRPQEESVPIEAREIHRGRVITVREERARFPDGTTGLLDVVHHPGASAVIPFLSDPGGTDPTILLIKQFRHAAGKWLLEVPAGRLDAGESPEDCARRELREETGCTAQDVVRLTSIFTTPGFSNEVIHLFMATGLTKGDAKREADEFIEPVPMGMSEALAKIEGGSIQDAKTIIAILCAAGFKAGR